MIEVSMRKLIILFIFILTIVASAGCNKGSLNHASESNEKIKPTPGITAVPTSVPITPTEEAKIITIVPIKISPTQGAVEASGNNISIKLAELEGNKAYVDPDTFLDVIITGKIQDRIHVEDSVNSITSIENLMWLDKNNLVIFGHINPSLSCMLVYDLKKKTFTTIKYGIDFIWKDKDLKTLIYISPKPHFSSDGVDRIVNYKDEVIYQAPEGITINGLAWKGKDSIQFKLIDENLIETDKTIKIK